VTLSLGDLRLEGIEPIVDGAPSAEARIETREIDGRTELTAVLPRGGRIGAIGVRLKARGVRQIGKGNDRRKRSVRRGLHGFRPPRSSSFKSRYDEF